MPSIKFKTSDDFHKKLDEIVQITTSQDKRLTTRLTGKKRNLDGRLVVFIKKALAFFGLPVGHTTPIDVAKKLSQFIISHETFLDEKDKAKIKQCFENLKRQAKGKLQGKEGIYEQYALKFLACPPFSNKKQRRLNSAKASLLIEAIVLQNHKSALDLIKKNQDVITPTIRGNYPVHYAAKYGSLEILKALCELHIDTPGKHNHNQTLLHQAVKSGNVQKVKFLLDKGADLHRQDINENSPLHLAKDLDVLKLLLEKGADPNQTNSQGKSPLHVAVKRGDLQAVKLLNDKACPDTDYASLTEVAIEAENLPMVQFLLDFVKIPHDDLDRSHDLLYKAFTSKNPIIAKSLIDKGIKCMYEGEDLTICIAAEAGNLELIKRLYAKGTAIPLELVWFNALSSGSSELVEWLIDNKQAQVHLEFNDGMAPLHIAAQNDKSDLCKLLLSRGAKINIKDQNLQTPLHLAALAGEFDVVKLLLEEGADRNSADRWEQTPLHIAQKYQFHDIIQLLRTYPEERS